LRIDDHEEQPVTESGSLDLKSAPPVETTRSSPVDAKEIQPRGAEIKKNISSLNEKSIRLVVFSLAGQTNAVDVDQVEEIILAPKVSPLLKAPSFVEGVMKLRGRIVPVVNLKLAMRLPSVEGNHENGVVVMVKLRDRRIGFRVDSVSELISVPVDSIEAPRGIVSGVDARFIKGLVYIGERFIVVLDLEAMLSADYDSILQDTGASDVPVPLGESRAHDDAFGARKIISFVLDDELFGAEIDEVAEIMEMTTIMPIPNVADFVVGLINLRGTIVPVVDLRARFGLNRNAWTVDSRIVIMKEKNLLVGVVVDRMWESLRLQEDAFQPAPEGVAKMDAEYFREICTARGRMVSILDIAKILADTAAKSSGAGRTEPLDGLSSLKLESHS
jgi:purine-binding chemotaxis protein CheW